MSFISYKSIEPLYIISIRKQQNADTLFKSWIQQHRVEHAVIQNNRLILYNQLGFEKFRITWSHDWNHIMVWDCWNRRHIEL